MIISKVKIIEKNDDYSFYIQDSKIQQRLLLKTYIILKDYRKKLSNKDYLIALDSYKNSYRYLLVIIKNNKVYLKNTDTDEIFYIDADKDLIPKVLKFNLSPIDTAQIIAYSYKENIFKII